jgi:aminoglycoside/choline kinase family phosphotransferase
MPLAPALTPQNPADDVDFEPLEGLVARAFPGSARFELEPMPGGASTRRYFRLRLGGATAVAMFVPKGAQPEEVVKKAEGAGRWPFLEIRDLLSSCGVDVPAIHAEDQARGWVLLEDLGDDTMANVLTARPGDKEVLYVRAVTDLARAQASLERLPEGSVVASRAFDEDLLLWEIQHFREWGLEARGVQLSAPDRARFDGIAERLARRIAGWPRSFVHRDYQSRNLMVRPSGALCWIDFQDALLGPRVYDLVALLNDSYQTFDRSFVEARLGDYAQARRLAAVDAERLVREFDQVTIQRKLKDAGRFVFIDRVKGNPSFLRFVEPTIAKVRTSLARSMDDADSRELSELLDRVVPG